MKLLSPRAIQKLPRMRIVGRSCAPRLPTAHEVSAGAAGAGRRGAGRFGRALDAVSIAMTQADFRPCGSPDPSSTEPTHREIPRGMAMTVFQSANPECDSEYDQVVVPKQRSRRSPDWSAITV